MKLKKCPLCDIEPEIRYESIEEVASGYEIPVYLIECPVCHIFQIFVECLQPYRKEEAQKQAQITCMVKWNELNFADEITRQLEDKQIRLDGAEKELHSMGKVIFGFFNNNENPCKFEVDCFISDMVKKDVKVLKED